MQAHLTLRKFRKSDYSALRDVIRETWLGRRLYDRDIGMQCVSGFAHALLLCNFHKVL